MNLEVTGYEVVPVLDGNEVEGTLEKEEDFDLALLDIMLPGKDGFELLGVMKEHGIPVIYITAKADVNSKIKGLRSGAEDYIVKPFNPMELKIRIRKNKNVAFTREQMLNEVWGSNYLGETRTIDVHIGQLRRKLDLSDVIKTIPKIGYRLEE